MSDYFQELTKEANFLQINLCFLKLDFQRKLTDGACFLIFSNLIFPTLRFSYTFLNQIYIEIKKVWLLRTMTSHGLWLLS